MIERLEKEFNGWVKKNKLVNKYHKIIIFVVTVTIVISFISSLGYATTWGYGSGNIKDLDFLNTAREYNQILYKFTLYMVFINLISFLFGNYGIRKYKVINYVFQFVSGFMLIITGILFIKYTSYIFPYIIKLPESTLTKIFLTNLSSIEEVKSHYNFFKMIPFLFILVGIVNSIFISFKLYLSFKHNSLKKVALGVEYNER